MGRFPGAFLVALRVGLPLVPLGGGAPPPLGGLGSGPSHPRDLSPGRGISPMGPPPRGMGVGRVSGGCHLFRKAGGVPLVPPRLGDLDGDPPPHRGVFLASPKVAEGSPRRKRPHPGRFPRMESLFPRLPGGGHPGCGPGRRHRPPLSRRDHRRGGWGSSPAKGRSLP